jgi:hypothetical protein
MFKTIKKKKNSTRFSCSAIHYTEKRIMHNEFMQLFQKRSTSFDGGDSSFVLYIKKSLVLIFYFLKRGKKSKLDNTSNPFSTLHSIVSLD